MLMDCLCFGISSADFDSVLTYIGAYDLKSVILVFQIGRLNINLNVVCSSLIFSVCRIVC